MMHVPAEYSYLRVLRLTVSSLAADVDFDIDEIESARAAVDELASILIGAADVDGGLAVTIRRHPNRLDVEGSVVAARPASLPDELVCSVLNASTTEWSCGHQAEDVRFSFTCERGHVGLSRRSVDQD
jgi:hypothetical protein